MSERDGYEPGVPCWVDIWQDDAAAAGGFYSELFGWEIAAGPEYSMARLRGRDVAGLASPRPDGLPAQWTTYVWVDDADTAARKAAEAGGTVLVDPFDSLDGGRIAIIADQAGAAIGVWQLGEHKGAQIVNEPGAWAMSALSTPDPAGAERFYGAVFGWQTEEFDAGDFKATMWRLPGYFGGEPEQPVPRDVVAAMMEADGPPSWTPNFWVTDADGVAATAASLGGSVIAPPSQSPLGKDAVLADAAGAVFSISQMALHS